MAEENQDHALALRRLDQMLRAFKESSARTRFWLYLSTLASLIIVVTIWHVGPGDWGVHRIREACKDLARLKAKPEEWRELCQRESFLSAFGLQPRSAKEAEKFLEELRLEFLKIEAQKRDTHIPLLGVTADSKDIGLIGGVALAITSLIVSRCMMNELRTMKAAFATANAFNHAEHAYQFISSHQVLFVAPDLHSQEHLVDVTRQTVTNLPMFGLLFFPLMAQLFTVMYGWTTFYVGFDEHTRLTEMATLGSFIGWLGILYATVRSVLSAYSMQLFWREVACNA